MKKINTEIFTHITAWHGKSIKQTIIEIQEETDKATISGRL